MTKASDFLDQGTTAESFLDGDRPAGGVWSGLIKPTLKAIPRVVAHTAASMAQMPVAGLAAGAKLISSGGNLNAANKVLQDNQAALDNFYLTTPEEKAGSANIGLAMKPFEMAREGWSQIGQATGIPYAAPVLGTIGEASAMFGLGGAKKAGAARLEKAFKPLEGVLEPGKTPPVSKPVATQWLEEQMPEADLQETLRPKEPAPYEGKGSYWDYLDQLNRAEKAGGAPVDLPAGTLDGKGVEIQAKPPTLTSFDLMKAEVLDKTDPALWTATDKIFMEKLGEKAPETPRTEPGIVTGEEYAGARAKEPRQPGIVEPIETPQNMTMNPIDKAVKLGVIHEAVNETPFTDQAKKGRLLFDERGSFSLRFKDDARDALKQNIPQNTPAGKVNSMFERTEAKRAAREAHSLKGIKDGLVRSMLDVSGNIKRELLNKDKDLGKQVVMDRELLSGASAKASLIIDEVGAKVFRDLRTDELEVLNRVIQSRRIIDIDNYKTGVKHPDGLSGKDHADYLNNLTKINPELAKKVNARADEYFQLMRDQVAELEKEGIMTPEAAQSLMAHEYSPRHFFQYLDPEHNYNMGGRKITVPDSGIKSLDEGSLQLLENNAEKLMAEVVARTQARIFRNRANKSLYDFAEKVPNNGIVRVAKRVGATKNGKPVYEDTPGGFEKVKVMIDGETKEMIMPWEMAQEWVKTDPLINQTLATVIGTISGAKILRPIATGYNPAFALTNMARDIALVWSSTMQYSKHLPMATAQVIKDMVRVAPDVIKRKGRVEDYINDGGGMTFMTHYGRFSGKGYIGEKLNSLGNIMGWVGETSEIWTRMALRERALQNGLSPKEATWEARRYLDFNQGGNVAKGIDTAVPYLNAAIQGTRGFLRGAKNNPVVFAYKMAQLGTVAASLYMANYLTNPECWESITDREKEANFIITTPIYFTDDKGQKKYYYMKIAKDQGQRIVTSLFDALMARQFEGKFPKNQVFMAISDLVSIAGLPPTLAAGISYLMNKDTWTNEDVWKGPKVEAKEEYRKSTHPFWVSVGQSIGLSPARMSNAAGKLIPPNNPFVGMVGGGYKIATGDLPQEIQDKSAMQFITEIPSVRRVLSTTNPYTPYRDNVAEVKLADDTKRFKENRTFDQLAEKYLKTKSRTDAQAMLDFASALPESSQDRLTARLKTMIKLKDVPDRTWWVNAAGLSPEAKAQVFYDRFSKSSGTEKKQMLQIADRVGGYDSDRFMEKFKELLSGHP